MSAPVFSMLYNMVYKDTNSSTGNMSENPCKNHSTVCEDRICNVINHMKCTANSIIIDDKDQLKDEITIVTAYFNLGEFKKGRIAYYKPSSYRKWMYSLAKIKNTVIAFLEKDEDIKLLRDLRAHLPANATILHTVLRHELWSFSMMKYIKDIYDNPEYPKHYPNTVIPSYSCAMHAKYELLRQATLENPGRSKYFAWMDIGYFRDVDTDNAEDFILKLPKHFEPNLISYTEVNFRSVDLSPERIFKENHVWVAGGFILGHVDLMKDWTMLYMYLVEEFLKKGLANTDQQVVYAAANTNESIRKFIQIYHATTEDGDPWFYLGLLCRRAGENYHDPYI